MTAINSVAGPLDTGDLGFTLMHEHILVHEVGVAANFPVWDRPKEMDNAVSKVKEAMARGVKTMVDLTPGDWRDIPFVQEVVRRTGMQVVVATGLYWDVPRHFHFRDADYMAGLFVKDIRDGIGDTGVKASIIKCAADEPGVTDQVEKVLRAASRAHRATGVPISTHTYAAGRVGLKQQDVFESEGVDLGRVVIGHSGDSEDIDYLVRLMERGSYIGMDRFGIDVILPTDKRVATIVRLCEMGYAGKMVLSHDAACLMDWYPAEVIRQMVPNWHYTHISDDVIPALRASGVSEEQVRAMTVDNPRAIFERTGVY